MAHFKNFNTRYDEDCIFQQEEEEVYRDDQGAHDHHPETQTAPTQPAPRKYHRNREHFATIRTASLVSCVYYLFFFSS